MIRCADAAGRRADPLAGTAPPADRWLLLEHPGPWPVDALAGAGIDAELLADLTGTAARGRARILLVRRPGRTARPDSRRWLLVSTGAATVAGHWTTGADLRGALAALRVPPVPATSSGTAEPVLLVCAHGLHDTCCAVRGRPVAAALALRWPELVWECSHVGGDRFAPNVVVLPDGFYYGGLDPADAVEVVAAHLGGRVSAKALRGAARYPPAQQAAVVAAFARYGPLPAAGVAVTGARHEGGYGTTDSRTFVELAVRGVAGPVRAEVVARRRPPAQLTCRAAYETVATEYRVERLG
ncbi:sucrase ferredoxin [uncultured Friedmanniella sp.]|uniref:sucrase ferredoxin n=1 Tax=uncultured Friedmanniella sp. TaxID=335381 RepID=UPI0035CB8ECB